MDYIAQPKDYWIAQGAITITLNALGNPNRTQGSVASGAAILCYIEGVDGLGYDNGHRFKTWPLSLSPTYFNSNTQKYVYAAIPRTATVGTQAVVVFPSEKLDVYGKNSDGAQVGSSDYYYIWLQGIISSSGEYGTTNRTWTAEMDFGKKGTDEDLYDDTDGEWYQYSKVSGLVTFLKNIQMKAGTTFHNLFLGYKELTGVATATTAEDFVDSEVLVATPSYIHQHYLRKDAEDVAQEQVGFLKGLWVGVQGLYGWLKNGNITAADGLFSGMLTALRAVIDTMSSSNYQGGQLTGTGWQITNSDESGNSRLEVDNLVVRMKMLVNVLEARKYVALGGNYVYSPASSVLEQVDYYDSNGNLLGYETIKVPFLVRLIPIFANTKLYSRSRIISNKGDVNMSNVAYFRCWIKADDGTTRTINTWQPGMLARCQTLDIDTGGGGAHNEVYYEDKPYELTAGGNKLYWREVIATGQAHYPVNDDGNVHSYVDISNITGHFLAGSDVPGVGDSIVCYGGTKVDYANVIVIETVGSDAPAIKEMMGVGLQTIGQDNTSGQLPVFAVTSDNLRTRISPKAGNRFIAPEFYIEATVGGARTNLATFIVNTEGVLSYVKGVLDDGKNLLTVTKGWEGPNGAAVQYDNKYFGVRGSSNLYSPVRLGVEGEQYCFSAYIAVGSQITGNPGFCYGTSYTHASDLDDNGTYQGATFIEVPGDTITIGSTTYQRYYFLIPGSIVKERYFTIYNDGGYWLYCPQLEVGTEPTAFASSSVEISSQIKQTADAITLAVQQGYATKSELQITADGITAEVNAIKAGKNLLTGALTGTNFGSSTAKNFTNNPSLKAVTVDSDGYLIAAENYAYIFHAGITIEKGKWYTVSFEAKTNQTSVGFCVFNYSGDGSVFSGEGCDTNFLPTTSGKKKTAKFKVSGTGTVTIAISIKCAAFRYPQLELGESATAFESGDTEMNSRIKQEATEISANVQTNIEGKLVETGINISGNNRSITAKANNFTIRNNVTSADALYSKTDNTEEMGELYREPYVEEQTFGVDTYGGITSPDGAPLVGAMWRRKTAMVVVENEQGSDPFVYAGWFKPIYKLNSGKYDLQTIRTLYDMIVLYNKVVAQTSDIEVWLPPAKFIEGQELTIVNAAYKNISGSDLYPTTRLCMVACGRECTGWDDGDKMLPTWSWDNRGYGFLWPKITGTDFSRTYNQLDISEYSMVTLRAVPPGFDMQGIGSDELTGEWVIVNAIKRNN